MSLHEVLQKHGRVHQLLVEVALLRKNVIGGNKDGQVVVDQVRHVRAFDDLHEFRVVLVRLQSLPQRQCGHVQGTTNLVNGSVATNTVRLSDPGAVQSARALKNKKQNIQWV